MHPLRRVNIRWSKAFAYVIGLLTTDGSLSKDGRHINFTSKDEDLVKLFKRILQLKNVIGKKSARKMEEKKYFQIQFGDVNFYQFLLKIGLMPNKTKRLGEMHIPRGFFVDFLRGHFDGDGSTYSYYDKRWKRSFMFYSIFCSASLHHINWLRREITRHFGIRGHLNRSGQNMNADGHGTIYQLKFAKAESMLLFKKLYQKKKGLFLERKYLKIQNILAQVAKLADAPL